MHIHPDLIPRSNEQGIAATVRTFVNFDVKERMDLIVEIQRFIRAHAASRLTPTRTRTRNRMTHLIIGFIEFVAIKHRNGFTSKSTITANGRRK